MSMKYDPDDLWKEHERWRERATTGAADMAELDADPERWSPPHGPRLWALMEWGEEVAGRLFPSTPIVVVETGKPSVAVTLPTPPPKPGFITIEISSDLSLLDEEPTDG